MFLGIYQPDVSQSFISFVIILISSLLISSLLSLFLLFITESLIIQNNTRIFKKRISLNSKNKYALKTLLILIMSSLYSVQAISIIKSDLFTINSEMVFSKDSSRVYFLEQQDNQLFFVIKNI